MGIRAVQLLLVVVTTLLFRSGESFITTTPAFTTLNKCDTTKLNVKVGITVNEGEPIDSAIRRFKREVNKSGHLIELRHKRYFENSQEKKKRKIVQAKNRKRLERMLKRRNQNQSS